MHRHDHQSETLSLVLRRGFVEAVLQLEGAIAPGVSRKLLKILVGAGRFERPTPCAQGRCATRLRYAPTSAVLFILKHFLTCHTSRQG